MLASHVLRLWGSAQPEIARKAKKLLVLSSWFLAAMRSLWRSQAGRRNLKLPETT
jgi:hypothetical protein